MLMIFRGIRYQAADIQTQFDVVESNVLGKYRGSFLTFHKVEQVCTEPIASLKYRGAKA